MFLNLEKSNKNKTKNYLLAFFLICYVIYNFFHTKQFKTNACIFPFLWVFDGIALISLNFFQWVWTQPCGGLTNCPNCAPAFAQQ